ncbi:probable LRR receptor-like serine/threonine-protein kinase RKF3 [Euphorbia lathyris]|uniref:probable LRR receptor-like serine/threonine-protein kinase RKF3 n=1 Tax=Euphorbia lathyris TaxID=212925 RepID=UPI003313E92A
MSFLMLLLIVLLNLSKLCVDSRKIPAEPSTCPLSFGFLYELAKESSPRRALMDVQTQCQYIQKGILFVRSDYLRTDGYFVPPEHSVHACWETYRTIVSAYLQDFDVQNTCGYHPEWISGMFMNVTSQEEFESLIPGSELKEMRMTCNQSLDNDNVCDSCIRKLSKIDEIHLQGRRDTNDSSDGTDYMFMYAAAFSNSVGSRDLATAKCFFKLEFSVDEFVSERKHKSVISGVFLGCLVGALGAFIAVWVFWMLHKRSDKGKKKENKLYDDNNKEDASLEIGVRSTNLVKFRIHEIRTATTNFSRKNIIGKGGYGNVFKGKLLDGSEVAFKRFKNCSASGDSSFAHEVEVIASVRHVNLVALRGYCTATFPLEGHQRIIVCDLMHNGSLYDHLFGSEPEKLTWPIRRKIALGTARGLAYLHNGVQPAIIHRDIKASNILLDDMFEAKVADFGLARFNLFGTSHLSTRAAGTLGYVAPEYALYGKLTEWSDVYSFGVVLLELLSGKKAYENNEGEVSLLTDWAWSLVKEGKAMEVIDERIPGRDSVELMEQYVHVGVICVHPELHARPTMYQVEKILETKMQLGKKDSVLEAS